MNYSYNDIHAEVKNKPLPLILGLIFAFILIGFISKRFSFFQQKLTPKGLLTSEQHLARDTNVPLKQRPTKLAMLYSPLTYPSKKTEVLSNKDIAKNVSVLIYPEMINSKSSDLFVQDYKKEGYQGDALVYESLSKISMSRDLKSPIDHDLDPNTPAVAVTEEWFLHKKNGNNIGERISFKKGEEVMYAVNPANYQVKQYIIAKIKKELGITAEGQKQSAFNGVFLDNVELSLQNVRKAAGVKNNNEIFEYATYIPDYANTFYADQLFTFTNEIAGSLRTVNPEIKIWGNISGTINNGDEWNKYNSLFDGAMMEDFALEWGRGPYSGAQLEKQLIQTDQWMQSGKKLITVAQGNLNDKEAWGRYALAAHLLVTDGDNSAFHYTTQPGEYTYLWEFPEYYYALGAPTEFRKKTSTDPTVSKYTRNFECGTVELELDEKTNIRNPKASITMKADCIPGISPTPSPTLVLPSPTNTPVPPTLTNVPPTLTPQPTFTPVPSPTLVAKPLVCGWCGTSCIPFDPTKVCAMVVPPVGFECKSVATNGQSTCQQVSTGTQR